MHPCSIATTRGDDTMSTIHQGTMTEGPTMDDVYEILAHAERRAILDVLVDGSREHDVHGLAERIRERCDAIGLDAKQYTIRLIHQHLPKMAEAGLVAYDPDDGRVSITTDGVRANLVRRHGADVFRED